MKPINLEMFSLENKVAVVTGSGDGIGKGIALEMAKAGADMVVAEWDQKKAEKAAQEIRDVGANALVVASDVTNSESVDELVQKTLDRYGKVDILVNNVGGVLGVSGGVPFLEISSDFWDKLIQINMKSSFLCTQKFAKAMMQQTSGGNIVNLSSLADRAPWMPVLIYGSAKAAISNFTVNTAVELGKHKIRVNAICPGTIETPLVAELYKDMPEVKEKRCATIPLGRLGSPEDIGKAAVFLASDAAGYMSGATLLVSGGLTSFL